MPEPSLADRRSLLKAALGFADGSNRVIRRALARGFRVRVKADDSFVTDADLAAERALRAAIIRRFPDHGIVGEEFPARNARAEFQWILDPIDGTLSFTRGIPLFGTIVGLHHRGRPMAGVIDHPALVRRSWAGLGLGAFADGKRLRLRDLSPGAKVEDELIATCDRKQFGRFMKQRLFDRLAREHSQLRVYSDCFGHTLAARGSVGAMVDYGIKIWDIAASQLLIEEAGGRWAAQALPSREYGSIYNVVLGKPRVVAWLLKRLSWNRGSRAR